MTQIRQRLTSLGLFGLVALFVAGCGLQGGGNTMQKYEKDFEGDRFSNAPSDGMARLYTGSDVTPEWTTAVEKGDKIGFRDERSADGGNVVAVAGDNEQPIQQGTVFDRTYYWKFYGEESDE